MIPYDKISKIPYGGDYNPEQWPEETWADDMALFKKANIDIVTLNVFSWASIQPDEKHYDFDRLDRIMKLAVKNGLKICMATSTGAHPAWMAKRHPDILRTDEHGIKRKFGGRHNSCPNSPTYRKYAPALARALAKHYKKCDSIIAWHISNEYGGECYCENCEAAFRVWLKNKYGSVGELNRAWDTAFWGHTFYDWDEVVLPDHRSEHFDFEHTGAENTAFQGISLDYRRFMSDSILECYRLEYDAVKKVLPKAAVTTNLMGFYKALDYQKWGKNMDFVSWDNYPLAEADYAQVAMAHDLMRGVGGGAPFCLMEQTPSVTNWHEYCSLKRPGVMRLLSYQAVAHGSDTVMFFQMKRSIGACEKYHGAVIDHVGTGETRVFKEVAALGKELVSLGDAVLGTRTVSEAAIIMTWDNWWSVEYSAGPSRALRYITELERYYTALRRMNINVDIIAPGDDFTKYKLVIAPVFYMVREAEDENIRSFVRNGGTFLTTFFSGYTDEHELVTTGGYPGKLRDILGIWVEEIDALAPDRENSFVYKGEKYPARLLCDVIHPEGAAVLDEGGYMSDFYAGGPVVTCNSFGRGKAYYVGCASSPEFYKKLLGDICAEASVKPEMDAPEDIEVTSRRDDKKTLYFVMNHSDDAKKLCLNGRFADLISGKALSGEVVLRKKDVMILKK